NIEIETVFAEVLWSAHHRRQTRILHTTRSECVGGLYAAPSFDGLRRLPAELADRRRGERDALERSDIAIDYSLHVTAGDLGCGNGSRRLRPRGLRSNEEYCGSQHA